MGTVNPEMPMEPGARAAADWAGPHLRHGHGQNQLHRPFQENVAPVVSGLRHRFRLRDAAPLAMSYLFVIGVGIWGNNIPVGWAFDITNFVWWIGIGHAGTLISAILLLLRQKWRTSINRFAEAMTIFAVSCAGVFPLIHVGRPWLAYWLLPYPNPMGTWPQFRSPLVWDVFAVSTYATVSLLFWFVGLIPDLATLRDRAKKRTGKIIYGVLAMGWRGSAVHWSRYETASLLLAGLATPLVISVHTVVSFDFAVGIIPGWHTTIFPPYFVAGAIYSGFAMVMTLAIPIRAFYHLEDFVTMRHLENMAKVMLATGLIVAYGYMMEAFMAFYSGSQYDRFMIMNRLTGPYRFEYWAAASLQYRHSRSRSGPSASEPACRLYSRYLLIINVGMWLERFIIIVTSLHRDFLAVLVGNVLSDAMGLGHVYGDHRAVCGFAIPVRSLPAHDFDFRNAAACGGDGREPQEGMTGLCEV